MQAGGEEHFAPPEEFDRETIRRFAAFCDKLRKVEKGSKSVIDDLAHAADEVGTTMGAKEMVAGALCRHIKLSTGKKQLACWYVFDKLAKEHRDTFRFLFAMHVFDLAWDFIPWEVPDLERKYTNLLEHWESVFETEIVNQVLTKGRQQRKDRMKNPSEYLQAQRHEEELWEREIANHQVEKGLDNYGEPCLAYLQGKCSWGDQCTQLHPEGLEGSLPPECRLGDWRCGCGTINRHFRRRCYSCPRERPQYRRDRMQSIEERAILKRKREDFDIFSKQFGYDYLDAAEAKRYWAEQDTSTWTDDRRQAWIERIGRPPTQGSFSVRPSSSTPTNQQPATTAAPTVIPDDIPSNLSAAQQVFFIAERVLQRGVHDSHFVGHLFLLTKALRDAVRSPTFSNSTGPEDAARLLAVVKLVFSALNVHRARNAAASLAHPGLPFLAEIEKLLPLLPFSPNERGDVAAMCGEAANP